MQHPGVAGRTFAIGDIHGEIDHLRRLVAKMPAFDVDDTLVFLGDYVDRGPRSAEVVRVVRAIERDAPCRVVCLRGNHEDGWLRAREHGWPDFTLPPGNGGLACLRSYTGGAVPAEGEEAKGDEVADLVHARFLPQHVIDWMADLPFWYEDDHGIYVHAGLLESETGFLHPRDTQPQIAMLWTRSARFFELYRGKHVVVGHTATEQLPEELSGFTPEDPTDLWAGECVTAIDTACGKGGFLTALELPAKVVYESREGAPAPVTQQRSWLMSLLQRL